MSRELVHEMYRVVDDRAWEALTRFYSENCCYERPGFPLIVGRAGLLEFYRNVRPIKSGTHRLHAVLEDRESLCAVGLFSGVLRSGRRIELEFSDFYRMSSGLIACRKTYFFTALV